MRIFSVSAIPNSTNFKQKMNIAKCMAAVSAAAVAIKTKENSNDIFKELSVHGNEEIFDEQYYQDYYNIDLNLAKSRAFRDRELFNPLRDFENSSYTRYDEDDVQLADNLIPKSYNENFADYEIINTDIHQEELPDCVTNPYLEIDKAFVAIDKKWIDRHKKYFSGEQIDSRIQRKIIKASTVKAFEVLVGVEPNLVKLGIDLYKNSGTWTETEDRIMQKVYKQHLTDTRRNIAKVRIKMLKKCSNEEILQSFEETTKQKKTRKRAAKS